MPSADLPRPARTTPSAIQAALLWRLLSAIVGIPVVVALVLVGGAPLMLGISAVLAVAYLEFTGAFGFGRSLRAAAGAATVAVLPLAAHGGSTAVLAALAAGAVASLVVNFTNDDLTAGATNWGLAVAGLVYIGLLGQHAVALRLLPDGRDWLLLAFLTTFATDTGAYAAGRALGRHKLAPRFSPGKTREGAAGGLLSGALAALALNALLGLGVSPAAMLALGATAAAAAQLGDLAESALKRAAGVKDMGALIPGHGGLLDRLDSLLFVVPLVYYAARWWLG